MPPANAAAIFRVLTDIANNLTPPLLARSDQQAYLRKLTATHKFTYYSATYGHTIHDAASLRKVLANTMRHHPNPEFGTAGGNAAVDTLFQYGCEMLEPGYVDAVMRAGAEEVVERRVEEEDESSEEEGGEGGLLEEDLGLGGDNEHDEDFVPTGRRLRRRNTPGIGKRKLSTSVPEEDSISSEEDWRNPERKKLKRKRASQPAAATTQPPKGSGRDTKKVELWRRSHVGEPEASNRSQRDKESGRDGAAQGHAAGRRQSCRGSSVLVGHSKPRLLGRSSIHEARAGVVVKVDDSKLRDALERLNRRVHTAIVQLWDEIGGGMACA